MTTLEKILQEIEEKSVCTGKQENGFVLMKHVRGIVKKHLSENHCSECSRRKFYQMGYRDGKKDNDGWIPCDPEKMPEKEVLCCDKYGELLIGWLSNTNLGYVCESEECTMYDVVAWMEKPEPYKPPVESAEEKSMMEREEFFKDGE